MPRELFGFFGEHRAHDKDGPASTEVSNFGGFRDVGHGKAIDSALHQPADHLREAVAVGIGLDDRDVAGVVGQGGLNPLQVPLESGQINLSPAAMEPASLG